MEKQEEARLVAGIALVYVIITGIFSFVTKLCLLIVRDNKNNYELKTFFLISPLWTIVTAGIIFILIIYNKKYNQKVSFNLLHNSTIRMCAGLLIAIQGLITLSGSLPTFILSIKTSLQLMRQNGQSSNRILVHGVITNIISMISLVCQIYVGGYLIKFYDHWKK